MDATGWLYSSSRQLQFRLSFLLSLFFTEVSPDSWVLLPLAQPLLKLQRRSRFLSPPLFLGVFPLRTNRARILSADERQGPRLPLGGRNRDRNDSIQSPLASDLLG